MGVYEKTVKKDLKKVKDEAKKFFGADGLGLELKTDEDCCLSFEGGGGHVSLALSNENKKETTVEVETREWDYQAKQFLKKI